MKIICVILCVSLLVSGCYSTALLKKDESAPDDRDAKFYLQDSSRADSQGNRRKQVQEGYQVDEQRTGDGQEVEISLTNGTSFSGEVLSVRDGSIVVTDETGLLQEALMAGEHKFRVLLFAEVNRVEITGSSYTLVGTFAGATVGCLGGFALGAALPSNHKNQGVFDFQRMSFDQIGNEIGCAALGTLAGGILGHVVGNAASTNGSILISPQLRDFNVLTRVARYPSTEPAYLKTISR